MSKIKDIWPVHHFDKVWAKRLGQLKRFKVRKKRWPYPTEDFEDFHLGQWLYRNRDEHQNGTLDFERYIRFKKTGYNFERVKRFDEKWGKNYNHLLKYRKKYPNKWPAALAYYPKNIRLGRWCEEMQMRYNRGTLKEEHKKFLQKIKFPINKRVPYKERFNNQINYLEKYLKRYGKWPEGTTEFPKGNKLANWVKRLRARSKNLSNERIKVLNHIGIEWHILDSNWNKKYDQVLSFKKKNGKFPTLYHGVKEYEYKLANWLSFQRKLYKEGRVKSSRLKKLKMVKDLWRAVKNPKPKYLSFISARRFVREQNLSTKKEWLKWIRTKNLTNIPVSPGLVYKDEYKGIRDWLGN